MRVHLQWLRSRPMIASLALIAVVAVVALILWWLQPVSEANFQRIQIGMSQTELYNLLGRPEYETLEVGLVEGPETYVTNNHISEEQKRDRGFQDYQRQQWASTEITIIVILDSEGQVVCRYSNDGQSRNPLAFLLSWVSRLFDSQ